MNDLPLEENDCPLCASAARGEGGYAFGHHRVVRCGDCGLWYLRPRLREEVVLTHYGDDYFSASGVGYENYDAQEPALRATFAEFLAQLERRGLVRSGGRMLEVGCARGWLLDAARGRFAYRAGTDFSAGSLERARERADAVYRGGLDAVPPGARFDAVLSFQVLEHVYDPHAFLEEAKAHLAPGGVFAAGTPDFGAFWRKLLGRRWPSFKVPEHVVYYTAATLARLWREHGLVDVTVFPLWHAFPLRLVARKMGLPAWIPLPDAACCWFPRTTLVAAGRMPGEP